MIQTLKEFPAGLDELDTPPPAALIEPRRWAWKEKPLAPWSFARRVIHYNAVRETPNAAAELYTLSVLFVLLSTEDDARRFIRDIRAYGAALDAFVEQFDMRDYRATNELVNEILTEAKAADVEVSPNSSTPQKKT